MDGGPTTEMGCSSVSKRLALPKNELQPKMCTKLWCGHSNFPVCN
jgi:hypothetical protein